MKQIHSDRYTIAWFKLAECISRGEKERALGVYRLLSYSFNDQAVSRQLEADIHLAFDNQKEAVTHYCNAAEEYKKNQRLLESAAVYEHLLTLQPDNVQFRQTILDLYTQLSIQSKINEHSAVLAEIKEVKK